MNKQIFLFLITSLFLFFNNVDCVGATTYYYLDGVNGNEGTADGSIGYPYKTYTALVAAKNVSAVTVIIYPATYNEELYAEGADVIFQASNWVAGQHLTASQMPIFNNTGGTDSVRLNQNNVTVRGIAITTANVAGHYGAITTDGKSNQILEDCLIYNNAYGIGLNGGAIVRRCRFDSHSAKAIYSTSISNAYTTYIDNNVFTNSSDVIYIKGLDGELHIRNNVILGYQAYSIASSGININSVAGSGANNIEIKNNVIGGGMGYSTGTGFPITFNSGLTITSASIDYNYLLGGYLANYLNSVATAYDGGHNKLSTWPMINSLADGLGTGNISFDDGYNQTGQFPQIVSMLDYMATKNMHGTWFIDFRNVGNTPASGYDWNTSWAAIKSAHDEGHEIGSHNLTHWQTTLNNLFKFSRSSGSGARQVIITNDGTNGSIAFQNNGITETTLNFTAPSDAELLANSTVNDIAWLKAHLPANWSIASQNVQCRDTMLMVELNPATYNAAPASEQFITPFKGNYVSGIPTPADGVYYWEIKKSKDLLEQKLASMGVTGYTCKTFGYPAWSYDSTAQAAILGSGYTSARSSYGAGNQWANYPAMSVTMTNSADQFWNNGVDPLIIRNLAVQAIANQRIFGTMFHSYSQFGTGATLNDFEVFADTVANMGISVVPIGTIVDRILANPSTWETLDGGKTYTLRTGVTLQDQTDIKITPTSVLFKTATTTVAIGNDFYNKPIYGNPDIGAYNYQPPYVMGSDKINVAAGAMIYGDGKFRDVTATSTEETDLTITPQSGSFPVYDATTARPEWLNVSAITWSNNGDHHKAWTESSSDPALTNTLHIVGDLEAGKYYNVAVDGTIGLNVSGINCTAGLCRADSYGKITFAYIGHYTTHTFDVSEGDNMAPTIASVTSGNNSGTYKAGQTIQININFSEVVNATSSVSLLLNTTPARGCSFNVSNSATSTCDYVVQDGDNAAILNVASISGTITDVVGNLMTDFTPAVNLSASKTIAIDTVDSVISISSFPIVNVANQNAVTISGACSENGLPVSLTIGSAIAAPTCSSGAWSTTVDLHTLTDGTLTANISQTDVAGNTGSNSLTSTKDTGGPAVTGLSNDATPAKSKTWTWSYGEESATFRYAIDQILTWTADGDFASTTTAIQPNGNGTYYLHVQAQDGAGNASEVATVSAILDNTPPVITVSGDNPATVAQGSTYADSGATASDNIDSGVSVAASGSVDTAALGDYTVTYNAADVAGNAAAAVTRLVHVTDQTAPTISELSDDSTPRKTKTWTWSGEEGDTFRFAVDRNATTTLEGAYGDVASAAQASGNGTYYLHVQSKDAAGNESEVVTVFALLDNTAPTITITNPNTENAQSKILTAITSDGLLTMSITTESVCDGSLTFVSYADHTFISESDNGKKICYKAIDTAANAAYQISEAIGGIDATPPSISELADDLAPAKSKTWNWSGEAETTFRFAIDQNLNWTAIGEYSDVASAAQASGNGTYYLHVQSKDAAGNESEVTTVFALLDNTAPTISETAVTVSRAASIISWNTNEAASSKVEYGLTVSYGDITAETDNPLGVSGHSVNLSGLDACSTYHYRAISKDGAGNEAIGEDETFKTECGSSQKPSFNYQSQVSGQIQNIQQEIARLQGLLGMMNAANTGNALGNKYSCAAITKNLYYGMANDSQVYCLQEFLAGQGAAIYPEARITGNFYQMTKAAVIRFQEKYQSDILTPFGLIQGNGFVGLKTRQKINQLFGG